jgi:hypothetical protein
MCVLSQQPTRKGQLISGFDPLVHPVLNEQSRRLYCAYCFGRWDDAAAVVSLCVNIETYPVLVCSARCRQAASCLDQEMQAITALKHGPPKYLPTAIHVYRVLLALDTGELVWETLRGMQTHDVSMLDGAQRHEQAVTMTVAALISCTPNFTTMEHLNETMEAILTRLKLNSFTITDSNDVSIGVGLFQSPAYRINHSCDPNVRQSFAVGVPGVAPKLVLHATSDSKAGDELCVSYIDHDRTRSERQETLWTNYRFHCQCRKCSAGL